MRHLSTSQTNSHNQIPSPFTGAAPGISFLYLNPYNGVFTLNPTMTSNAWLS
jgi:hypothetical protein